MDILEQFISHYVREMDFFEETSKICAQICESELNKSGIRAIVTYRAKRIDRLKDKLIKRSHRKSYECMEDIYSDIVDLAGVRIALYFPSDKDQIDRFIKSQFNVKDIRRFPNNDTNAKKSKELPEEYKKLFSGYHATHYRVQLKKNFSYPDEVKYLHPNIEIQVASVLMHAWSEVEHDLVYKPLNGRLSIDEYEILDELNGLILAGELALKRLHRAVKDRVAQNQNEFSSHYELAAFIYGRISSSHPHSNMEDLIMGRVDLMYKFIKNAELNSPKYIDKYIDRINPCLQNSTIVEQIIDKILEEDASLYKVFIRTKGDIIKNPYSNCKEEDNMIQNKKAFFYFVDQWTHLQIVVRKYIEKQYPELQEEKHLIAVDKIQKILGAEKFSNILTSIRSINAELIYNSKMPPDEHLIEAGKNAEVVINEILNKFDPEERTGIMKRLEDSELNLEE